MTFRVLEPDDLQWDVIIGNMPESDVHFLSGYARAQGPEAGARLAAMRVDYAWIAKPFRLRPIPGAPNRYDVASLYGYGGPLCSSTVDQTRVAAVFDREFVAWCRSQSVVSEFCVLHPLLGGHQAPLVYAPAPPRKRVVVLDVDMPPDHLLHQMRSTRRHSIVAAQRAGVRIELVEPDAVSIGVLAELYGRTMERKSAAPRWHMDYEAFERYVRMLPRESVLIAYGLFNGQLEVAAMILLHGPRAYYHFAGRALRYPHVGVGDVLIFEVARWLRGKAEQFHLGGGVTASGDDPLWLYKTGFGGRELDVHTTFRVFDRFAYERLSEDAAARVGPRFHDMDFEPAYRRDCA